MSDDTPNGNRGKSLVVVGLGNIGSPLVGHLARMPDVRRIALMDRDAYELKNLRSQDITPEAIGRPKAVVQTERLRTIAPRLDVEPIVGDIEDLPYGSFRAHAILAALDSRRARYHVNQVAWRLGVPWIDAGVESDGMLARVQVYVPGNGPCLECGWDHRDYAAIEQAYPCDPEAARGPATNAPSSLGSLAAALQAIECQKLLNGQTDRLLVGRQVLLDASYHKHYLTRFRRNPNCRFDHQVWSIDCLDAPPADLTLAQAIDLAGGEKGDTSVTLQVEGRGFVRAVNCTGCGCVRRILRLAGRLQPADQVCPRCRGKTIAVGFETLEHVGAASLPGPLLDRSLESVGMRPGEVFSVGLSRDETVHFQLGGDGA